VIVIYSVDRSGLFEGLIVSKEQAFAAIERTVSA
jgi:hypothetical protein